MSSEIDYDPQSAGHNYDWSAMSEADAIEIVLCRQEALYEALNGSKPLRRQDIPSYQQMVRWMPILADYLFFVGRSRKAEESTRLAQKKLEDDRDRLYEETHRAKLVAASAIQTMQGLEKHLRGAVMVLDMEQEEE